MHEKLATICRCDLTVSAGQGETTPSLLAVLLLMHPQMLLAISAAWAHCQLLPSSLPLGAPGPFPQSCSPAHQPVLLQVFIPSQLRDFALVFAEFCEISVSPFLQPLKDSPTLQHIGWFLQFDVLYKLDKNAVSKCRSVLEIIFTS